ncbi:MAG: DEAD/DEAH box helicase [Candidatus Thermoplasmatota archaeon]
MFIDNPLIKQEAIEARKYQVAISNSCINSSTLVVLPTGLGKTVIGLIVIADAIQRKKGKVLFLAPTKPLVEQHYSFLKKYLLVEDIAIFTGEVSPKKRSEIWNNNRVIVSTPQVIENDIILGKINGEDISLIIFDEAHRAVGNYSYVFISGKVKEDCRIVGMTASPGATTDKILEVCGNLRINKVEIRSEMDEDVRPYVHPTNLHWATVDILPEMEFVIEKLRSVLRKYVSALQSFGLLRKSDRISTKEILEVQRRIQARIKEAYPRPPASLYHAAIAQAAAMKINHAIELAETQGIAALKNYFQRMKEKASSRKPSKSIKLLMNEEELIRAMEISEKIKYEHPKLEKTLEIVKKTLETKKDAKIIVFTHYRDTSEVVTNELNKHEGIRAVRFIGQADRGSDKGLNQKEQAEIIEKFKRNEYNVLVGTSVAEEGLDIPATDLVIFYEPIPSEIRTIQRRGRTGRQRAGRVVILITKETRDEAYYWSSKRKEKRMRSELEALRLALEKKIEVGKPSEFSLQSNSSNEIINEAKIEKTSLVETQPIHLQIKNKGQITLDDFYPESPKPTIKRAFNDTKYFEDKLSIIVDLRELHSKVVKELTKYDLNIKPMQLKIGDYLVSDRIGIERKSTEDFIQSLIDGRLFQQIKALKSNYMSPILIIEGESLFTVRQVSQSAIFGAIASIIADYHIPIITAKDEKESASLIYTIAKREIDEGREVEIREKKSTMRLDELQRFVVEGLPNVSAVISQRLLSHFGSVKAVMDADEKELCKVKGLGKKTAMEILRVLRSSYMRE